MFWIEFNFHRNILLNLLFPQLLVSTCRSCLYIYNLYCYSHHFEYPCRMVIFIVVTVVASSTLQYCVCSVKLYISLFPYNVYRWSRSKRFWLIRRSLPIARRFHLSHNWDWYALRSLCPFPPLFRLLYLYEVKYTFSVFCIICLPSYM